MKKTYKKIQHIKKHQTKKKNNKAKQYEHSHEHSHDADLVVDEFVVKDKGLLFVVGLDTAHIRWRLDHEDVDERI